MYLKMFMSLWSLHILSIFPLQQTSKGREDDFELESENKEDENREENLAPLEEHENEIMENDDMEENLAPLGKHENENKENEDMEVNLVLLDEYEKNLKEGKFTEETECILWEPWIHYLVSFESELACIKSWLA